SSGFETAGVGQRVAQKAALVGETGLCRRQYQGTDDQCPQGARTHGACGGGDGGDAKDDVGKDCESAVLAGLAGSEREELQEDETGWDGQEDPQRSPPAGLGGLQLATAH